MCIRDSYKSRAINIFFGIRDKQMYATNDELLYKNACKTADPSAKETDFASYNLSAYREINISRQTEILKTDTSIKTTSEIRMEVTQFI